MFTIIYSFFKVMCPILGFINYIEFSTKRNNYSAALRFVKSCAFSYHQNVGEHSSRLHEQEASLETQEHRNYISHIDLHTQLS